MCPQAVHFQESDCNSASLGSSANALCVTFDFLKKISEMVGRLGHRFSSNWCGRRWRLRLRLFKKLPQLPFNVQSNISGRKASVQWKMQSEIGHLFGYALRISYAPLVTLNQRNVTRR